MQRLRQVRDNLHTYVTVNQGAAAALAAVLVAGLLMGALAVGSLGAAERQDLVRYLSEFIQSLGAAPGVESQAVAFHLSLGQALQGALLQAGLIWLLGVTVVGVAGIFLLAFIRGFAIGFAAGFLAAELGWRGMLFSLAALLPQNLLAVPALLVGGSLAASFAWRQVLSRWQRRPFAYYQELSEFSGALVPAALALVGAALVEAVLSPLLMSLASHW